MVLADVCPLDRASSLHGGSYATDRDSSEEFSPDKKRSLLASLLKENRGLGGNALSVSQQRYWVLRRLAEETIPTHIVAVWGVEGGLDVGMLQASVGELVERHEQLRTAFVAVEGRVFPVVREPGWLSVVAVDLARLAAEAQDGEIERLIGREARQAFDVATPPLMRVTVVRRAAERHVVVIVVHQLVADPASVAILGLELAALYAARSSGGEEPARLTPAGRFEVFAARQREWLKSAAGDAALAYWLKGLADLPVLRLPTDRPRPAIKAASLRGARCRARLPGTVADQLAALARAAGGDLFIGLLAALQALLARYSGQSDIAVGCPVANRAAPNGPRRWGRSRTRWCCARRFRRRRASARWWRRWRRRGRRRARMATCRWSG